MREHLAFPFGEGEPLAVEEVLPQYEFAKVFQKSGSAYRTSPAPCGGTLPKGEGFRFSKLQSAKTSPLLVERG